MKKSKVLVASTLLTVLAGLVGCGNNVSTSTNANSSTAASSSSEVSSSVISSTSSSSTSSSSTVVSVYTEDLTQEMFSALQGGYSVEFMKYTAYDGEVGTAEFFESSVDEKNYAFKRYIGNKTEDGITKGKIMETSHYQPNPEEDEEWLYNAGLSIGNTVIYTPVMGRDKYTFQEIELTWDEGGYSNAFALLSLGDFTRVDDENKWALNVNSSSFKSSGAAAAIASQFFGEQVSSDIEYFYLLTNGNEITGYDLKWKTYLSYENYVSKVSSGKFTAFGSDVVDFMKPIEGREKDADFDNAIASLKNYNYKVKHEQAGYDYTTKTMISRGHFEGECDGETLNYYYFTSDGKKYMNYAYYNYVEDGETYLQGATNIKGNYYPDVLYSGSLTDVLPSFNISSEMFIKSSESTDKVLVYKLDESIVISLDNDNAAYSSFDSDGYNDRTIHLTVTIDKENNTVAFHNETAATSEEGLVETVYYSEIGEVATLRTAENTKEDAEGLTWEDLFSNDEAAYEALCSKFPADLLENLPTFGGGYAYVNYDPNGIIFVNTYEAAENTELVNSYGAKLANQGYEEGSVTDSYGNVYKTYYTTFANGKREYGLTLTLITYWNSVQEWGQFQVQISIGAAKK